MNTQTPPTKEWLLLAKNADGKEVEAGRFVTDAQAIQYAQDYRVEEFRLKRVSAKS